ncbi:MAG: cytochrome c oxidase assembly protein [Pseudomonadota bacterium]|nr:cytochrome c oxidase assembly protein [Pseudomonadota bacterium]
MKKKNKHLIILSAVGVGMFGLAYAFVPLYEAFCKLVGIPIAKVAINDGVSRPMGAIQDREVTIRFIAHEAAGVPVDLEPITRKVKVRLNEPILTAYTAQNSDMEGMMGTAIHTMIALSTEGEFGDVSEYVDLQQCFCFEEQYYPPQEEVSLPLSFFVTGDLPEGIHTINFSYTLFESEDVE